MSNSLQELRMQAQDIANLSIKQVSFYILLLRPPRVAGLVTFTNDILIGKLHFLCSDIWLISIFSGLYLEIC